MQGKGFVMYTYQTIYGCARWKRKQTETFTNMVSILNDWELGFVSIYNAE